MKKKKLKKLKKVYKYTSFFGSITDFQKNILNEG